MTWVLDIPKPQPSESKQMGARLQDRFHFHFSFLFTSICYPYISLSLSLSLYKFFNLSSFGMCRIQGRRMILTSSLRSAHLASWLIPRYKGTSLNLHTPQTLSYALLYLDPLLHLLLPMPRQHCPGSPLATWLSKMFL